MKVKRQALIVLVLMVAISIWVVNLVRPRTYSGDQLSFEVGSGTVTIDNPSSEAIPVQLNGAGSRSYTVSSTIDEVSGRSTREGSGRNATQLFAFELPSGSSAFTIERGTAVTFTADTEMRLTATVRPLSAGTTRNTLLTLIVAVAGSLYYISSTMQHRWIAGLRGEIPPQTQPVPAGKSDASTHGQPMKSFGDNISRKTD